MTTKTEVYLKDFNDNQPDLLIATLEINLTPEQRIYLKQNKHDPRTLLLKKFNLRFSTKHSKLQVNRAIEMVNEPKVKPTGLRDPNKPRNVFYRPKTDKWEARITVKKKVHRLYVGSEEGAIKAVKEFKLLHGLR